MLLGACQAAIRPSGAQPVAVAAGPIPAGPAAPKHGLPVPSLEVTWQPPQVVAGDTAELASALKPFASVGVHLGPRLFGRRRLDALARSVEAGGTKVVGRHKTELAAVLDVGSLAVHRVGGANDEPPRYTFSGLELRAKSSVAGGSEAAALLVGDAPVDLGAWRKLPAHAHGTCREAFETLATGQEQSLAYLESFLDHADAVLWQIYRAQLRALLPALVEELGPYRELRSRDAFETQRAYDQHVCGHAYWTRLQDYAVCGAEIGQCTPAPRMYLVGGARIASAEPTGFADASCPGLIGRDVGTQLRSLAQEAAEAAIPYLDQAWVILADRAGTITEVHEALEDVCTPRRRRFAAADLEAARLRLARIGRALSSAELDPEQGAWELEDSSFFVPGIGPVTQVARFAPGRGTPAHTARSDARGLRQFVLSRALCRSGYGDTPLAVTVVDNGRWQPTFLGFFYEEELFCADLPLFLSQPQPSAPQAKQPQAKQPQSVDPPVGNAAAAQAPPPT